MLQYDACGPIWDGAGLSHVITSYLDAINISFDAAANLVSAKQADAYLAHLSVELDELCLLAAAD